MFGGVRICVLSVCEYMLHVCLQIQAVVGKITDMCWDKCVSSKPGKDLTDTENNVRNATAPCYCFHHLPLRTFPGLSSQPYFAAPFL